MGFFSDIALVVKNHTTYEIGLIQARGYRTLKHLSAAALRDEGITTIEWAILGILSHHKKGLRASELAKELGVQPPLVSRLLIKAEKNKWISVTEGEDRRERVVKLTEKGEDGVVRIEKIMRVATRPLLKGVRPRDLLGYLRTLSIISENGRDIPQGNLEDYIPD